MDSTIHFIAQAIQREPPTRSELQRLLLAIERLVDTLSQSTRIQLTFTAIPRPQYSQILLIQNGPPMENQAMATTIQPPKETQSIEDNNSLNQTDDEDNDDNNTNHDNDSAVTPTKRQRTTAATPTTPPQQSLISFPVASSGYYTASAPSLKIRLLQQR
jgi:hypothetical protein